MHDWKSCVRQRTEGSNPSFSAKFDIGLIARSRATEAHELRQVREEAAVMNHFCVPRECLAIIFFIFDESVKIFYEIITFPL